MAEYQGSIELISGLIPKNNQDFPLVSAHHVQVDNTGKRLDLVLQSIDASVLDRIEAILPDLQNAANFETYNTLNTNVLSIRDNLVLAQETQPESEDNRIWIKPTNDEYLVPSYEELQDVKKGVSNLLNEITDVKEINNLLVPVLNTNVDTSSSEVHQHDNHYSAAVTLQANHTYMAYGSVTISNLTGYTAGAIALKMFGSDSYNFVCATKKITTVKNGVHEVYGTFTPTTSGVVYATLENTNHPTGTAYTYTANFNKLYLFDLTETEATQAECLAVVQKYNYSGILYTTPGSYQNLAEEVTDLKSVLSQIFSDNAKAALLNCFQHVAFLDDDADYYGALKSALYADTYPKITALFNPGLNVIYTDDTLDSLKQYLTVTYYETEESSGTTISSSNYTLSGTLVAGASTVYVAYDGLATSFVINGVVNFYDIWDWSLSDDTIQKVTKSSLDRNANVASGISIRTDQYTINRRAFVTNKGRAPIYTYSDNQPTSYYPIPIPVTANKITVSVTPSTQYVYLTVVKLQNDKYGAYTSKGWTEGISELSITPSSDLFLFFNTKYDSAGSSYPTEPSEITVSFSEEA